jgi:hypothetical protein
MLPNRESGPQNQPSEKVAVSTRAGCSRSMGGIVRSCKLTIGEPAS